MSKVAANGFKRFSKQEKKVFSMLIQEFKSHEIAKKMDLDQKTVGTYKLRLLEKTKSKTIIGLYLFNTKHQIVELPEEQKV